MPGYNEENQVSIAMCTYNGSPFLKEQLDSLLGQSICPLELVVCDDHSTDETVSVLQRFARKAPFTVEVIQNKVRLGAVKNFSLALSKCRGKYIALCDQDDVWAPNRLELSLQALQLEEQRCERDIPLLAHSDLIVTDQTGSALAPSFMKLRRLDHVREEPLKRLVVQNFVTGCSVLINRPLMEAALPIPDEAVMHDWWLALVAAAMGKIIFVDNALVFYRRHDHNVIGPSGFLSPSNLKRIFNLETIDKEFAATINQAEALRDRLKDLSESPVPPWLSEYIESVAPGGFRAVVKVHKLNVSKQGITRNTLFCFLLLKQGYKGKAIKQ